MTHIFFILLTLLATGPQTTDNDQNIAIKETQAQRAVFIQYVGPYWTVGPVFRTMGQYMTDHNQSGPMYARYETNPKRMRTNKMRSEIGFWVEGSHEPQHPYKSRMQEPEQVAYQFVDTANPNISKQYDLLTQWIRSHDFEPVGPISEIHYDSFEHTGANKHTVEIQMPIRKRGAQDTRPTFADRSDRKNKNRERIPTDAGKLDPNPSKITQADRINVRKHTSPAPARVKEPAPAPATPEERIVITPKPNTSVHIPNHDRKTGRSDIHRDRELADQQRQLQLPEQIEKFAKQEQSKPVYQYERSKTPRQTKSPRQTATPPQTITPRTVAPLSTAKVYTNPDIKPFRSTTTQTKNATRVDPRINTETMTITELIEANEFDRVAELIMPGTDSIAPNQELWFGQIIFRLKAVARGLERMYPGEGGTVVRLVNALSGRYEIISIHYEENPLNQPVVRTGTLTDPTAQTRRELMRTMDNLLGKLAVKRLSADELQEEVFDVIDRLYDITRDH